MALVSPQVAGIEHRDVEARGLRFHVAEAGPPAGGPLLLLHGWPQHWFMWRHQIPVLAAAGYRVIAPDLRGFGWSDAPPGGYDKENMATDVLALMDALGLERVKLMGHDWGGWIGFMMCLRAPERFEKFLALNIPHLWAKPSLGVVAGTWKFWYQAVIASPKLGELIIRNRPDFVRFILRHRSPNAHIWSREDMDAFAERLRQPERAHATVQLYRTFLLKEFGAVAAGRYKNERLEVPTLLLFGEDDFAIAKAFLGGDPADFADDMRIEFIPDTGHFIAEERPELVCDRALEFFGEAAA